MDVKSLLEIPPWEWPRDAAQIIYKMLVSNRADESERLVAAELAGDFTVINDELAAALVAIIGSAAEPEQLRATAAISLGPVLEHGDMDGLDDPDDITISKSTFRKIHDLLQKQYKDESNPKLVRRRILEASVRSPQKWHQNAIKAAYSSGDEAWMLSAVFSMGWVRGFDDQILQALKSANADIHYEAVTAAGNWELSAAWSYILPLVKDAKTPKRLRIAAIGAVASIRPQEARSILGGLANSDDEEIAEAADEAITMADVTSDGAEGEEDLGKWIH